MDESQDVVLVVHADRIAGMVRLGNRAAHFVDFIFIIEDDHIASRHHDIADHEIEEIEGILDERVLQGIQPAAPVAFLDDAADFIFCIREIDFVLKRYVSPLEELLDQVKPRHDDRTEEVAVHADHPCLPRQNRKRFDKRMRARDQDCPDPVGGQCER